MSRARIDEATERAIVGHYALGATVAAICALLKVSRPTVYKVLRRRGEQPNRGSLKSIDEIRALYEGGMTLGEVAACVGITRQAVASRLKRAGVRLRNTGPRHQPGKFDEALVLREAGMTYRQIGAKLGISIRAAHYQVSAEALCFLAAEGEQPNRKRTP